MRGPQPNNPFGPQSRLNRGLAAPAKKTNRRKKNKMQTQAKNEIEFEIPEDENEVNRDALREVEDLISKYGLTEALRALAHYAGAESIYSTLGEETRLLKQYWDLSNGLDRLIEQFKAANPNELVPEEFEEEEAA
jgi:hypothetical protein